MNTSARKMLLTMFLVVLHLSTPAFALASSCCALPEEPARTSCCQKPEPKPAKKSCCSPSEEAPGQTAGELEPGCRCGVEPALPVSGSDQRTVLQPIELVVSPDLEHTLRVAVARSTCLHCPPAKRAARHLLLRSLRL